MRRFNDIADRVLEYDPDADLELLQRAYVFTAKVHDGQARLSGEPYLIHPIEVAGVLVDMRLDDVTIAAGLLHDTVEKGSIGWDDLRAAGADDRLLAVVEALTEREGEPEHEYLRRCAADPLALRIKRVDIMDKLVERAVALDAAQLEVRSTRARRRLELLERLAHSS